MKKIIANMCSYPILNLKVQMLSRFHNNIISMDGYCRLFSFYLDVLEYLLETLTIFFVQNKTKLNLISMRGFTYFTGDKYENIYKDKLLFSSLHKKDMMHDSTT